MYLQNKCGIKALSISHTFQNVNSGDNNSDGSEQPSVSVNNEQHVANIDNNDGLDSWNMILDYNTVGSQHAISILYKYDVFVLFFN